MSTHRIKVSPKPAPVDSYQEEIAREFREVCTCIDELLLWARVHAPPEIVAKLELLKSFTVVANGQAN
jgi:hypothetical protein